MRGVPETSAQAQKWAEFLLAEVDDWAAKEVALLQEGFDRGLLSLVEDIRCEPERLCTEEQLGVCEVIRKMRWLVRHEGEMLLRMFEQRLWEIEAQRRATEEQIFQQWEEWIEKLKSRACLW